MKKKNIYKITSYGSLYMETSDFFRQPKIQQMIKDLMASELFKSIEREKIKRQRQKAVFESQY